MNELYRRVLRPLAVPLVAIGVIVFVTLDVSRVLLAAGRTAAVVIAAAAALAVLFGATRLSRRPARDPSSSLRMVLIGAGLVLIFGGLVGGARLDEQDQAAQAARARQEEQAPTAGASEITITAFDLGFRPHDITVPAGAVRVTYVDDGLLAHTLVIDGVPSFKRLDVQGNGDRVSETVTLAPGTYTFYCDVPGHRQAGMQGTVTVT